jgi:hypothetical protein
MQLYHHQDRVNLGGEGRVLFAFQCADWNASGFACEPYSFESGSTSCFVLEERELTSGLSNPQVPGKIHDECRVAEWIECDDHFDESHANNFRVEGNWMKLDKSQGQPYWGTKTGSIPFSIIAPLRLPFSPETEWRFIAQASEYMSFVGSPPSADDAGCTVVKQITITQEDGTKRQLVLSTEHPQKTRGDGPRTIWHQIDQNEWYFSFANFGMGIGYAFLAENKRDGCFAFSR